MWHPAEPLTEERIKGWNAALFPTGYSGIQRIHPGKLRSSKEPMRVVSGPEGRGGFEGGLTTRTYVSLTRTSRATAGREIADLVAKGLLVKRAGGGRSTSYEIAW